MSKRNPKRGRNAAPDGCRKKDIPNNPRTSGSADSWPADFAVFFQCAYGDAGGQPNAHVVKTNEPRSNNQSHCRPKGDEICNPPSSWHLAAGKLEDSRTDGENAPRKNGLTYRAPL